MQYFNPNVESMIRDYAGDFVKDYDIDAAVEEYLDEVNAQLEVGMTSLLADGSVQDWDWMDQPGWEDRKIFSEEELKEIFDSVDLQSIMERHDLTQA